jgi:hypothetical protein
MMVIGLSLTVLRQRWYCLLFDFVLTAGWLLLMGIKIPGIQFQYQNRKNTLNNQTLNRTKHSIEQKKTERTNSNNKLATSKTDTESLSVNQKVES